MNFDFRKLVIARFLFTLAVQMQAVVLGWRIYEILQDPFALGMIGLSEAIPAIGLALYAGYIVDRMQPLLAYRRIMFVSLISASIVLLEHVFQNQLSVLQQAGGLYFAAFLTGTARAFSGPSIYSALPRMIKKEDLLKSNAYMSTAMQVARIAGPALGGILYGFMGAVTTSSVVCVSLLGGITSMILIKTTIQPTLAIGLPQTFKSELFSGLKFVVNHKILFPALTLDMVSVFFGGVTALLPIYANEILMIGPKGLGILRGAPAIGAAAMSFYLAKNPNLFRSGKALLWTVAGFGCSILIFGISTSFVLSILALVSSGVFDSVSMVIRSAIVQFHSPDNMRGKIAAVNSIFIGSSNEIGEVESGVAAKLMGVVPAACFGGFICLLTVAIVARASPSLRNYKITVPET